jgi:hypothetical protein
LQKKKEEKGYMGKMLKLAPIVGILASVIASRMNIRNKYRGVTRDDKKVLIDIEYFPQNCRK